MNRTLVRSLFALLVVALLSSHLAMARVDPTPVPLRGSVMLHGGGALSKQALQTFFDRGGNHGRMVLLVAGDAEREAERAAWAKRGLREVRAFGLGRADLAAREEALAISTAVWVSSGAMPDPATARQLAAVVERGGVVGGLAGELVTAFGAELLPGVAAASGYELDDHGERLQAAVVERPGHVGYGVESDTTLVVIGRNLVVHGSRKVHLLLAASVSGDRASVDLPIGAGVRQDHVALRRAALARAGLALPPPTMPAAAIENGTIVVIGGGRPTRRGLEVFIEAAGGPAATILVVQTALGDPPPAIAASLTVFEKIGVTGGRLLHARDRGEAASAEFIAQIDRAGGVWFSGGRQWRLVDRYLGTPVIDALHRLLARGGAVGGTSAGATICGDYLVRGDPLGNTTMMAEGYEQGFALLPGIAIDQHFTRRNRLSDLVGLKRRRPELLALGIDESTAAVFRGTELRHVGNGTITVLDRPLPKSSAFPEKHFTVLHHEDRFDIRQNKVIARGEKNAP